MLRGINVSGQKSVRMPELKKLFESLGYHNVQTYIQSGNVVFGAREIDDNASIALHIENAIGTHFGFDVPVIIRSEDQLHAIIEANPYCNPDGSVAEKIYITFLSKVPDPQLVENISTISFYPDRFEIKGRDIYLNCAGGYGTTKLSNTFFENKLKVRATTRNWNTVITLMGLLNSEE